MIDIVELALGVIGLTAGDGAYETLIADGETPAVQRQMATLSGCGLVVRGLYRRWLEERGLDVPASLRAPYAPGSVLGALLGIGMRAGAIETSAETPEPGDVIWLLGPEHVELYLGDGWRCAGGQKDAEGRQTVLCVERGDASGDPPAYPTRSLAPRTVARLVRWSKVGPYLEGGGR